MPHWTNLARQSQPLAHKSLLRGPEICDLGLGGRPTWRCLKPKTPLCADLRCEMWPRAPQLVVCCVVGRLAHTVAFFGSDVAFACRRRPGFQGGLKLADRLGTCGLGRQT